MKPDNLTHQHQMVLYNINISVDWIFQNDKHHVTAVNFHACRTQDLKRFMSGNVFKAIVEDIENYELKQKWM